MVRYAVLIAFFCLWGCGASTPKDQGGNLPASGKQMDSVTMDKPVEESVGAITLAQAAEKGGFKPYPGQEGVSGESYKRNDGGFKDEITFDVNESLEKVASFFKQQGIDTKIQGKEATSLGMTKKNAQLMIIMNQESEGKVHVVIKSLRY